MCIRAFDVWCENYKHANCLVGRFRENFTPRIIGVLHYCGITISVTSPAGLIPRNILLPPSVKVYKKTKYRMFYDVIQYKFSLLSISINYTATSLRRQCSDSCDDEKENIGCTNTNVRVPMHQDTEKSLSVQKIGCLCCLMTPGLSKDIRCHVWPYFSTLANHQIRHQATHKVSCQPGDCKWPLLCSSGVCVGMYGLT